MKVKIIKKDRENEVLGSSLKLTFESNRNVYLEIINLRIAMIQKRLREARYQVSIVKIYILNPRTRHGFLKTGTTHFNQFMFVDF